MRILLISQFYPPEPGAASVRAKEFAENWAADGHQVTVLTGFPNYLNGRIYDGYRNRLLSREERSGVSVARVWTWAAPKEALVRRGLAQIAFLFFTLAAGIRLGRFDVVVASSPPFIVGFIGLFLSRLVRARFVFDVRDLYPESAVALGVIRNRSLIGILRRMERWIYRGADLIVAVTEGIRRSIIASGVQETKIKKITNGVNTDLFDFREEGRSVRKKWGLDGRFVVQYAGLIGLAQGLDAVLDAARILKDRQEIVFVLVGEGIEKDGLIRRAAGMGLTNVRFVPGQSPDRVADLMSAADVGLALKKKVAINEGAIPVKMFEYMACRRPVIVGGAAEAEAIAKEADAGICVDPTVPKDVARAVLDLYENRPLAVRLGENGREFVKKHYSRKGLSGAYLSGLRELVTDFPMSPKEEVRP